MEMLTGSHLVEAGLDDWRHLAQGLHARFAVDGLATGAALATGVADVASADHDHVRLTMGHAHVDVRLASPDATFRDGSGVEHVVEWITQRDLDLARAISALAASSGATAEPDAVVAVELGLDVASSATVAPVWAALLAGDPAARGRGTPTDEVRDATGRVPNLWFGGRDDAAASPWHLELYVSAAESGRRIAAAVAAGGAIVDDAQAPGMTVVADQEGNRCVVCVQVDAAT
ncbi:4a-hydroxytetrahydrobiopterin dehydratase [Agrococcus jejuensis]|uniref:4a-hydroxytetrahydrobiopterin dehydratase n=1 Tax=Agrococcus jejuensis TaxID=399736 RepID=UPI0011A794E3|nr:VOC family protein [Agrococcus jejuensis]